MELLASILFCLAWGWATWTVTRLKLWKSLPAFSVWVMLSAGQAMSVTMAGWDGRPSEWWTLYVWLPVECLVMAMAAATAIGIARWKAVLGAVTASLVFPDGVLVLTKAMGPGVPGWYREFVVLREWLWIAVAVAVLVESACLLWKPKRFAPGVYRSRCLFGFYAAVAAITGSGALSLESWANRRFLFRMLASLCLIQFCLLRRATCSEAGSAEAGAPAYSRRPARLSGRSR